MEYADVVLATVVVAYPLSLSVLVALGSTVRESVGVGSLIAAVVILHALFVNPPTRGGSG